MRKFSFILMFWIVGLCLASDAQTLAYTSCVDGYWQICLARFDGANQKILTTSRSDKRCLRYDPIRKSLRYRDAMGELYRVSQKGGEPEKITLNIGSVTHFDYHAKYGYLVSSYAPNALDNICIWWFSPDTHEKRLLISAPHISEMPRWIDAESFVFVRTKSEHSSLVIFSIENPPFEIAQPHARTEFDPCPSPSGSKIVYCLRGEKYGMDLWVADTENIQTATCIYSGEGLEAEPCWSPDGAWIYFSTWDGKNFRIARIASDGKGFTYITEKGMDCRESVCWEES